MDPNVCLADIASLMFDESDEEELLDRCYDLSHWIRMGGFEPDWSVYPQASELFRRECAE